MESKQDKTGGDFFWNICDFWEEESTRDDARGGHEAGGRVPGGGRAPYLVASSKLPLRALQVFWASFLPKIISIRFYPVWTPFDIGFLRNIKHATNRNWHWALDQYVSPKNSIKSCQKYMKVEEYWHGTIKNYRYDGDVSASPSLIPARPRVGK